LQPHVYRVDEELNTVTLGGGVLTGPLIRALADKGYYTALAETDSVGVIGSLLGGGGGAFSGGQGWLIDHVVSLRLVTADGEVLTLSRDSTGEDAALLHSLCGAGHGLGVVTELTMGVHSVAALGLTEDRVWLRRMILPAGAIGDATRIFERLQPLVWPTAARLVFTPAPPGSPIAGQPVVVLLLHYFDAAAEAKQKFSWLYDDDVTKACALAVTVAVAIPLLNESTAAMNEHGDFKRIESLLLNGVNKDAIEKAFSRYLQLIEEAPDARQSRAIFLAMETSAVIKNGDTEFARKSFFEWRSRSVLGFRFGWWTNEETAEKIDRYFDDSTGMLTAPEQGPVGILPSSFKYPADLTEAYSEDKIKELWRVQKLWDPKVFSGDRACRLQSNHRLGS
jgi:hypothetical protein